MASINTIVKRKQYLWLGIVVVGAASAIGGALYLSDVDMSGNGEAVAEQEPVPDMTGVVDTTFDDKVRQHATTEMQVTAAQMQKQYEEIRRELDVLNKQRGDDQRRIEKLGQDNAALAEQVKALGANPVTATGEPVPQMPASPPGPEGEPQPGNTPVSFPPQGSVAVPPPTAFYPGNGVTPPPQVTYQSVPVPNRIQRKVFATAAYGAGDVLKMGIGGGASKAAQTLSDYYIKRAEQYHPVIPIGAGNEVTVVFQDGFQLKTVEEMALERTQSRAEEENQESPVPVPPSAESHLNGFNTDQMLKQLGNLNPQQFMSGSQGGGNDGK
ncbi:TPA: hypothetical protein N6649_002994 [Escherichia coli]|nr:hypothetical protein [Escherichia coli]